MSRAGIIGIGVLSATGIWLVAAPFVTGQQPDGAAWTTATRNDVIVGALLTLLGFTGFFTVLAGHIADMYARRTDPG
ncbi:SPW repeat protein [Streptosporangium sp. NBC_01639]|uniref:SPW repeat domain-containing protein n=1 Tax=unclassified Streptosporangium TaxID=2632669 RepID=UPI002DD959CB|nr:SPW repeat protein [Streptosporangium sp. NBC_01756]WSC86017.1 SPW repeat protein [Streptosporangium sp. NBC_01756]WTD55308.1 SPW repeat protein [Streptosporangium sp. NBC_01639]